MSVTRFLVLALILPLGWALGLVIARLWVGPGIVEPPFWAVPLGVLLAVACAFVPYVNAPTRLVVMAAATAGAIAFLVMRA